MKMNQSKLMGVMLLVISLGWQTAVWAVEAAQNAASVQAPAPSHAANWYQKLGRGSLNVVSAPVELFRQIHITTEEKSLLHGWTIGLVKGLGSTALRLGAGMVDMVTCAFEWPTEGRKPLIEPEYVWQKPGLKYV